MIALEEDLIEKLGDSADVDGHDMGSGERNIFIFTSDPVRTFPKPEQSWSARGPYSPLLQLFARSEARNTRSFGQRVRRKSLRSHEAREQRTCTRR